MRRSRSNNEQQAQENKTNSFDLTKQKPWEEDQMKQKHNNSMKNQFFPKKSICIEIYIYIYTNRKEISAFSIASRAF